MTPENLQQIKKLWIGFAAYYQLPLSDTQVTMYAEDCKEHRAETIAYAMQVWRKNPKHLRMPLPGQLLEFINGGPARMSAAAIAHALVGAIKARDYNWHRGLGPTGEKRWYSTIDGQRMIFHSFEEAFMAELGPVAWKVVHQAGGWEEFVESFHNSGNETAFKAQLRDVIEAALNKAQAGDVIHFKPRPALPPGEDASAGAAPALGDLVKKITEKGAT